MNTHFEILQELETLFRRIPTCREMHQGQIGVNLIDNLDSALNAISADCSLLLNEINHFRSNYILREDNALNLRELMNNIGINRVEQMIKEFRSIVEQYEREKEFMNYDED